MQNKQPVFKRILLKFSGEALMGQKEFGIDSEILQYISDEIATVVKLGVEVAIVIGGGNFFRGADLFKNGVDRITGDYMGILATVINALAMRDIFDKNNLPSIVMSAIPMNGIAVPFDRNRAISYLQKGRIVILAGGTGNPLVTTDSAMSLRGVELKADILLKATNVDGVYSSDPSKNPSAKLYKHLTYKEALAKELAVMDLSAFCQCRDHNMRLRIFNMRKFGALFNIVTGEDEGTLVETGE
jgi:uridylate kinase